MRRRSALVVAAVVLVGVGLGTSASATPETTKASAVRGQATPLPPVDSVTIQGFTGVSRLATSGRIGRAKIDIVVPTTTVAVYVYPQRVFEQRHQSNFVLASAADLPKNADPTCDHYYGGTYSYVYVADIDQRDKSRPGVVRSVGRFPDTSVSFLAFGSIPVTAVLHVRQVTRNGRPQPILLDPHSTYASVPQGQPVDPEGKCDPAWDGAGNHPVPTVATGEVEARISDVRVDGRSVAVGNGCRTATAIKLNAVGETAAHGGQYVAPDQGGLLYQRQDRSTEPGTDGFPRYPGSTNLTIPPFTGCRGPSGDVSRLVTALASGPDNTLAINQSEPILGYFDPTKPSLCDDPGPFQMCVTDPKHVLPPAPGR